MAGRLQDRAPQAPPGARLSFTSPNRRVRAVAVRRALRVGRIPAPHPAGRDDACVRAIDRFEEFGTAALVVIVAFFLLRFVLAWGSGLMG